MTLNSNEKNYLFDILKDTNNLLNKMEISSKDLTSFFLKIDDFRQSLNKKYFFSFKNPTKTKFFKNLKKWVKDLEEEVISTIKLLKDKNT